MNVHLARRLVGAATAATVALTALVVAPAAQAVPVPDTNRLVLWDAYPNEDIVDGSLYGLNLSLHRYSGTPTTPVTDAAGIVLHGVVSSCGKVVQERTITLDKHSLSPALFVGFGPDGKWNENPTDISDRIGESLDYVLTVTEPGYDPYTFTGTTDAYTTRPTCKGLSGNGGKTIPVQAWSYKYAQPDAKVGSNLTVSKTRAAGARVSYAWTLSKGRKVTGDAKVVSRSAQPIRVKPAYRGQQVTLTVTVTKGTGKRAKLLTKTIRYGKAY